MICLPKPGMGQEDRTLLVIFKEEVKNKTLDKELVKIFMKRVWKINEGNYVLRFANSIMNSNECNHCHRSLSTQSRENKYINTSIGLTA
ncbi:MAG: hypothetical protein ACQEQO_02860 [Thermodesulfobacteriota bacterium]